jgi:hypothetical protein|tara:strand:+ start:242 stop:409 length:168 start_codon:yes stop_codon:yes gene_type:complete
MSNDCWRYFEKYSERVFNDTPGANYPLQAIPLDFVMNDKLFFICSRKAAIYSQSF